MRIAALILTVLAALACLWFFAVSEMLIRPGAAGTVLHDDYYAVAQARFVLPYAMLGLMGGALTLALWQRPRRWGLWLVLAGGFLAVAFAIWNYVSLAHPVSTRVPTYVFDAAGGNAEDPFADMLFWLKIRRWLLWIALAATVAGWGVWVAGRLRPPAGPR